MDSCISSQFPGDLYSEELLSIFKDPDPFLCDVAQVMESCIRDVDLTTEPSYDNMVSVDIVSSSCSSNFTKKINRKSKKKSTAYRHHKSYVCDWCDRRACFKSGQGLRFHKTLRCPRREAHLGQNFFKCFICNKAFVTTKGLDHHRQEMHPETNDFEFMD